MFQQGEPELWKTWSMEFAQMHPSSFTAQKLYLINPIRRKYPLKSLPEKVEVQADKPATELPAQPKPAATASPVKPSIPKPVFKPKPKTP